MKNIKKGLLDKAMKEFDKHDGGAEADPKYVENDVHLIKENFQKSLDSVFPELMKKSKHRKHVIFDDDVFKVYDELSQEFDTPFSSLINSALRSYAKDRMRGALTSSDPVEELLAVRNRERELLKSIKELNLSSELKKKLG